MAALVLPWQNCALLTEIAEPAKLDVLGLCLSQTKFADPPTPEQALSEGLY